MNPLLAYANWFGSFIFTIFLFRVSYQHVSPLVMNHQTLSHFREQTVPLWKPTFLQETICCVACEECSQGQMFTATARLRYDSVCDVTLLASPSDYQCFQETPDEKENPVLRKCHVAAHTKTCLSQSVLCSC